MKPKTMMAVALALGGAALLMTRSEAKKGGVSAPPEARSSRVSQPKEERRRVEAPSVTQPVAWTARAAAEPPVDDEPEEEAERERASAARSAVVRAIRGRFTTEEERRDAMLSALRASGATEERWTSDAPGVFDGWKRAVGGEGQIMGVECHYGGCAARIRFPDQASYEATAAAFRRLREDQPASGRRVQTPAVSVADGGVEASWIVLRPEVSTR